MRPLAAVLVLAVATLPGCKKKGGSPGPDGWLVGDDGLMAAVGADGTLGEPYELGTEVELRGIACRGTQDAFVVGAAGTFLRTFDGGASWEAVAIGTAAELRAVAADAAGGVLVAGDDHVWISVDSGARFAAVADGSFISIATSDVGEALALDDAGRVWQLGADGALEVARLPGARAVTVAHRGGAAAVVGDGGVLARSADGGTTWTPIARDSSLVLNAAWTASDGNVLAVGDDGAMVTLSTTGAARVDRITDVSLRALHIDGSGAGLIGGDGGTVLATEDAGESWRVLDLGLGATTAVRGVDQLDGHGHW